MEAARVVRRRADPLVTVALLAVLLATLVGSPSPAGAQTTDCDAPSWVATWALPVNDATEGYDDQTLRIRVTPSFGGSEVRIRLSNALGTEPVTLATAHIGVAGEGAAVAEGTNRQLTFDGSDTVEIPAGGSVLSDAVGLTVTAFEDLVVSVYAPHPTGPASGHTALATMYVADGDQAAAESGDTFGEGALGARFLTGVDVYAPNDGAIVTFGDSITEGFNTERVALGEDGEAPYTDTLAQRLHELAATGGPRLSVVNVGISGNRVLQDGTGPNALKRLDRDVLAQAGLAGVIMMEGINDLHALDGDPAPAALEDMAAGYTEIVDRVEGVGADIWLSPLTPAGDTKRPTPFTHALTPEHVERRHEINQWIRGDSGAYDGRADFETAVLDPQFPNWIAAEYDGGDNLHPNNAGYVAMGESIDLTLFDHLRCGAAPATQTAPAERDCDTPSWVASWAAPATTTYESYDDQTVRVLVTPGFGGEEVRLRLSNAFGDEPATLDGVHVGLVDDGPNLAAGSNTPVTFDGATTVSIPAGGSVVSDPVTLDVTALEDLAVSFHAAGPTPPATGHDQFGRLFVADGDEAGNEDGAAFAPAETASGQPLNAGTRFLTAMDVYAPNDGALVAVGDSITEGTSLERQTVGEEAPYTDTLARRLNELAAAGGPRLSLVNVGIGGNQVLEDGSGESALKRLDRDVLSQAGLVGVIMMEGINDLHALDGSPTPPALEDMAAGYAEIVERVRAAGADIWLSPLTPAGDTTRPTPFTHSLTPLHVQRRHEINRWIKSQSGAYDGRIDFEAVVLDPQFPNWIQLQYDTGDNLHPNNAGYVAMGESIHLDLFDAYLCTASAEAPGGAVGSGAGENPPVDDAAPLPATGGTGMSSVLAIASVLGALLLSRRRRSERLGG